VETGNLPPASLLLHPAQALFDSSPVVRGRPRRAEILGLRPVLDPIHHRVNVGMALVPVLDEEGLTVLQLEVLQKLLHHLETLFLDGLVLLRKADAQVVNGLFDAAAKAGCVPHFPGHLSRVSFKNVPGFDAAHPSLSSGHEVGRKTSKISACPGSSDHLYPIALFSLVRPCRSNSSLPPLTRTAIRPHRLSSESTS
jgi:hypothetical protein